MSTSGRFGNPDASRSDAITEYLAVPGATPNLNVEDRLFQDRVIVGKKGAGKTVYLRALYQELAGARPKLDDERENRFIQKDGWLIFNCVEPIFFDEVVAISRALRRGSETEIGLHLGYNSHASEKWTRAWEAAIAVSVYRLVFGAGKGSLTKPAKDDRTQDPVIDYGREQVRQNTRLSEKFEYLADFMKGFPPHESPITQLRSLLQAPGGITRFLRRVEWDVLNSLLAGVANHLPQIAIFIDALDDQFDKAPVAWLECQEGLFRSIFRILNRGDSYSNRVHVIAALREIAFSSLLTSEHANRFITDSHIRYISWDDAAARSFLAMKIARLKESGATIAKPEIDLTRQPLKYWTGFDTITNIERGIVEPVADYILRHTRLLPRDIVLMGNQICNTQEKQEALGAGFTEETLRQAVTDISQLILKEAVNSSIDEHLTSMDYMSETMFWREDEEDAATADKDDSPFNEQGDSRAQRAVKDIRDSMRNNVDRFFSTVGKEIFTYDEMWDALLKCDLVDPWESPNMGEDSFFRFDNILYRHGLIAYRNIEGINERWRFCWRETPSEQNSLLPTNKSLYGFHSCVLDGHKLALSADGPVA